MSYATYKPVEVSTVRSSMTPCIFDDDPAERDALNSLIMDMGYEPVCTSDPEEALRLILLGRCRLVFAFIWIPTIRTNSWRARSVAIQGFTSS